ncbi:peptide/nickel transport system substrate-binding protein [Rhizobium sp. PP-CC-2G-626]|nr:peptide/nickel transport system substrate-binding protein [Rhizobium sp. PP-CC-2G-626]
MLHRLFIATGVIAGLSAGIAEARTLRVGYESDILGTDPAGDRDSATDTVIQHLFEGLTAFREDGSVGLLLAKSEELSADGKTLVFRLRDGLMFHNGDPLTANDVVWNWKRYLDPKTGWRCLSAFDGSKGGKLLDVVAPDRLTVEFRFDAAMPMASAMMARPDCGGSGIASSKSVAADGTWQTPIGTGPFKLGEWRSGETIRLDRFDDYAALPGASDGYTGNKKANVDAVLLRIIADTEAAKNALLAGDIDLIPDVPPTVAEELTSRVGFKTDKSEGMSFTGLILQTNDPILKDARLRQAIERALDRKQIANAMTGGYSSPNCSPIPKASPWFSHEQAECPSADPVVLSELLTAAGYKGQTITLQTSKDGYYEVAIITQAMLAAAGMNVQLEVSDWATQFENYDSGRFQMQTFSFSARMDPSLSFDMFTGSKAEDPRKLWDNASAQKLLNESFSEADPIKRRAIFDTLFTLFKADVPMIVFYNGSQVSAFRDAVTGYKAWLGETPRFWRVDMAD